MNTGFRVDVRLWSLTHRLWPPSFLENRNVRYFSMPLRAENRLISAGTVLETGIVLEGRQGDSAGREFDLFVVRANLQIVPVDADQIEFARSAWRRYGKGRHPAALNFGDCFAYALAKSTGEPLLAKGTDFQLTDIELQK